MTNLLLVVFVRSFSRSCSTIYSIMICLHFSSDFHLTLKRIFVGVKFAERFHVFQIILQVEDWLFWVVDSKAPLKILKTLNNKVMTTSAQRKLRTSSFTHSTLKFRCAHHVINFCLFPSSSFFAQIVKLFMIVLFHFHSLAFLADSQNLTENRRYLWMSRQNEGAAAKGARKIQLNLILFVFISVITLREISWLIGICLVW